MVLVTEMIFIAIPVSFYLKRIIVNTHETASWENNGITAPHFKELSSTENFQEWNMTRVPRGYRFGGEPLKMCKKTELQKQQELSELRTLIVE